MAVSRVLVVLGVVGFVLAVLGGAAVLLLPRLFTSLLDEKLPLVNNSDTFNLWRDIPVPIYRKFYFFNLTNPDEFLAQKEKPRFEEVGPYSYRARWVKEGIVWNSNGTISYREVKTYTFDRNASVGSLSDRITTVNAPLVSAGVLVNKIKNFIKRKLTALIINRLDEHLLIERTVGELLFDGYNDPLVATSRLIDPDLPDTKGKFGWMIQRNGSNDGIFTVYTGKGGMDKYNVITRWNGKQNLTWWKGGCDMINGTNGELNPPLRSHQTTIDIFNSDFCRSFEMQYTGPVSTLGIPLERFEAPETTFDNGLNYTPNACFDTQRQFRSGVMDLGPCQHGLPVAVSFPHFYMADPHYVEQVDGLHPNGSLHAFHLDLEPRLGLTVGLRGRVQLNVVVEKNEYITRLKDIPELVYPVVWEEVHIDMDDAFANHLKSTMENPMFYSMLFAYVLLSIGGILFLTAVALMAGKALARLLHLKDDDSVSPLVDNEQKAEDASEKDRENHGAVIT